MKLFERSGDRFVKMFNIKTLVLLVFDAFIISASFFIASLLLHNFSMEWNVYASVFYQMPVVIIIYWLIFELFQMYRSLWQFASFEEVIKGFSANATAIILSYLACKMIFQKPLEIQFFIIALFLATFLTLGVRLSYRIFRIIKNYFIYQEGITRSLIIGAGDAGSLVLKEVIHNPDFDNNIVGFLDDDKSKHGRTIHNVPVLGSVEDISGIVIEKKIDMVFVAIPKASQKRITDILNLVQKTGVQIKLFPPFYELLRDRKDTKVKLRDVNIEDLLGRDEIKLEEDGIREYIDGKTVLVTGGGGSIGSELCRQLRHFNPERIIILDIYENNAYDLQMEFDRMYRLNKVYHKPEIIVLIASVRDKRRLNKIFNKYKPDVVFHAAAHKHVPLMERSPMEALKNNVLGTYNVAVCADAFNVEKFVLISTDKAVNPTNIMGASKRAAEKVVFTINKTSSTDFTAVRFGNVLGSNGSVIPLFRKQMENGGPLTVTHPEIIRYFMTIPEACQLVIQTGAYAKGGELFVLDMGQPVRILDLAENMIRLSGLRPYIDIDILFTGLRPGEKMYEELLLNSDKTIKTSNEMIFIEKENNIRKENELPIMSLVKYIQSNDFNNEDYKELINKYVQSYRKSDYNV